MFLHEYYVTKVLWANFLLNGAGPNFFYAHLEEKDWVLQNLQNYHTEVYGVTCSLLFGVTC